MKCFLYFVFVCKTRTSQYVGQGFANKQKALMEQAKNIVSNEGENPEHFLCGLC